MSEPPIKCKQGHGPHGDRRGRGSPIADVVMVTFNDWIIETCWRHAVRLVDHLQRLEREWV